MSQAFRLAWFLAAAVVAVLVGWRIGVLGVDDVPTRGVPQPVRSTYAYDPVSVLGRARQQMAVDPDAAARAARALLRREPLQAEALVLLARLADARQDPRARDLFEVALQRAPRDPYARAWMIATQLRDGQFALALANIDKLLGMDPAQETVFAPIMARLADKPAFAAALVQTLGARPPWCGALLADLLRYGSHAAVDAVYGALQDAGDLDRNEAGAWLERLMSAGLWGEAYSRWVSNLHLAPGTRVPLVYNGDFVRAPAGIGFDWRMSGAPGVLIERVAVDGRHAVRVTFLGRRVPTIPFAQTLLLAPGDYELEFTASASDLRSDRGLQWAIRCLGGNPMHEASEALRGSFDWRRVSMRFSVPDSNCPAQELGMVNPGADGVGKIIAGTLWFRDFAIQPAGTGRSVAAQPPMAQPPQDD